jgi:hypothetical protein
MSWTHVISGGKGTHIFLSGGWAHSFRRSGAYLGSQNPALEALSLVSYGIRGLQDIREFEDTAGALQKCEVF